MSANFSNAMLNGHWLPSGKWRHCVAAFFHRRRPVARSVGERSWMKARERRAFVARKRSFEESSMRHRYRNRSYDTVLPFVDAVACTTAGGGGGILSSSSSVSREEIETPVQRLFGTPRTNRPTVSIRLPVNACRLSSSFDYSISRRYLIKDIRTG